MGYTGIGLKTETEINNLNPANYAMIRKNSFFYDIGTKAQYNTYSNSVNSEAKTIFNFSNLALAFPIMDRLGMGISLVPYSDVGYTLLGIQTNVEGSNETFTSNVTGLGGLSDLKVNFGYGLTEQLRFGLSTSFLFGNIEEEEALQISNSFFELSEQTNYSGIRLGLGLQFDFTEKLTLGSTIQFPTSLQGHVKRSALKNIDATEITVENNETGNVDDFKMPLELGLGLSAKFFETTTLSVDYKKNYWNATGQTENIGTYVDQDIYALGLEYVKDPKSYKYVHRIKYRLGLNYDTGYLEINNNKIEGYNFTSGIGLPIRSGQSSMLNLSYTYGTQGLIQNILIKENYHMLTLNVSLEDLWFLKRKID